MASFDDANAHPFQVTRKMTPKFAVKAKLFASRAKQTPADLFFVLCYHRGEEKII